MRKILPVLALCFFSSSLAATGCPVKYFFGVMCLGILQQARGCVPAQYRGAFDITAVVAVVGTVLYKVSSKEQPEPAKDEAKSHG